jgi:hypothetical protein
MNRTELFNVLFWALGLLSMAIAYSSQSKNKHPLDIYYQTCDELGYPDQASTFVYVLLAPQLVTLVRILNSARMFPTLPPPGRHNGVTKLIWLSIFNLAAFAGTLGVARFTVLPPDIWSFTKKYGLTLFGALLLILFTACPILLIWHRYKKADKSLPLQVGSWLCYLQSGFIAAYALHFFMTPYIQLAGDTSS